MSSGTSSGTGRPRGRCGFRGIAVLPLYRNAQGDPGIARLEPPPPPVRDRKQKTPGLRTQTPRASRIVHHFVQPCPTASAWIGPCDPFRFELPLRGKSRWLGQCLQSTSPAFSGMARPARPQLERSASMSALTWPDAPRRRVGRRSHISRPNCLETVGAINGPSAGSSCLSARTAQSSTLIPLTATRLRNSGGAPVVRPASGAYRRECPRDRPLGRAAIPGPR